jgi:tetratricopeptide (TPR) repeat protein
LLAALAAFAAALAASWSIAPAETTRTHTVKQILVDGKDEASAGVTVTPKGAPPQTTIQRNEPIPDGTRVDVPAHVVVVIASTDEKSTATLEPGASITFVSTDKGELLRSNAGKTFFDVVHNSLDFFRVQYGDQITAGVSGTAFSIDATEKTVAFRCTSDEVTITRSGYIRIGPARKAVTLADVISAMGTSTVSYAVNQTYLAEFSTFAQAAAFYQTQAADATLRGDTTARIAALSNVGYAQEAGGQYAAASETLQQALTLAQHENDRSNEALITLYIGFKQDARRQYAAALQSFQRALALYRELGDHDGEARAFNDIGLAQTAQGQYAAALQSLQQALALFRQLGDRDGEARAISNIGLVQFEQGQFAAALRSYEQGQSAAALQSYQEALAIYQQIGDRDGEAHTTMDIALVQEDQGQYPAALQSYQQSLALNHELGDRAGEAGALTNIGGLQENQAQYAAALQSYQQSLALFRDLGDGDGEAGTLTNIGAVQESQGQYADALQSYQQALAIYQQIGVHGINVDRTISNIGGLKYRLGAQASPSPQPSASP